MFCVVYFLVNQRNLEFVIVLNIFETHIFHRFFIKLCVFGLLFFRVYQKSRVYSNWNVVTGTGKQMDGRRERTEINLKNT